MKSQKEELKNRVRIGLTLMAEMDSDGKRAVEE